MNTNRDLYQDIKRKTEKIQQEKDMFIHFFQKEMKAELRRILKMYIFHTFYWIFFKVSTYISIIYYMTNVAIKKDIPFVCMMIITFFYAIKIQQIPEIMIKEKVQSIEPRKIKGLIIMLLFASFMVFLREHIQNVFNTPEAGLVKMFYPGFILTNIAFMKFHECARIDYTIRVHEIKSFLKIK